MRAALIGSVDSSLVALEHLAGSALELVGVAGFEPQDTSKVSGWSDLRTACESDGIEYVAFTKVNDETMVEWLRGLDLDFLFVVGLSQLISEEVISSARVGCVGYHPTQLPLGRGRAPVAWVTLGQVPSASTLFEIMPGADEGGILEQVRFDVQDDWDAGDVSAECSRTLGIALDRLVPRLATGWWMPAAQDESRATWIGKRVAQDGLVDWTRSAQEVDRLIRAAAAPHPGAYCYNAGRRLQIPRSLGPVEQPRHRGVVGKVLHGDGETYLVQCGDGVVGVVITDEDGNHVQLREGAMLRTRVEDELFALRGRLDELERKVEGLLGSRC